mmetsp:Transcript_35050/g.110276  ORF Transcript_35050/g.110276 Transcript_35050/m.110276 type:complete len:714 (-) Transcript_35050:34-2175(-)|eukprot:CAMPEP_0118872518 /NCGR_PEP_ID=MMETSP1163-20130328/14681_1 /TAXON_ID=124430 /ORGANISM="Phaeomonas parva, Strain CCMP2877" /LENGTH=713 /DNA_ID=CAMNT_0006807713 /DNA_START=153 /DNA_END=2294 /DNA_ORIENTATION=+
MARSPEEVEAAFAAAVAVIREQLGAAGGEDGGAADAVAARLQRDYDEPPAGLLQALLGRAVSGLEARALLFCPTAEHAKLYPALITMAAQAGHPAQPLLGPLVALAYLVHMCADGHWKKFTKSFCSAGGVTALATLLVHDKMELRGQALHCILGITGCADVNWFEPPVGEEMAAAHRDMLAAGTQNGAPLLAGLLRNGGQGGDLVEFPGSSFECLQLLGFWLSWTRLLYGERVEVEVEDGAEPTAEASEAAGATETKGAAEETTEGPKKVSMPTLKLSPMILQKLDQWCKGRPAVGYACPAPEEEQLAKTLLDDFGKQSGADVVDGQLVAGLDAKDLPAAAQATLSPPVPGEEEEEEAKEPAAPELDAAELAAAAKERGNDKFAAGDLRGAIKDYGEGLAALDGSGDDASADRAHLRALLLTNRATASLALIEDPADDTEAEVLAQSAAADARAALDAEPTYIKASLRLSQALHATGDLSEAALEAQKALDAVADKQGSVYRSLAAWFAKVLAEMKETNAPSGDDAAVEDAPSGAPPRSSAEEALMQEALLLEKLLNRGKSAPAPGGDKAAGDGGSAEDGPPAASSMAPKTVSSLEDIDSDDEGDDGGAYAGGMDMGMGATDVSDMLVGKAAALDLSAFEDDGAETVGRPALKPRRPRNSQSQGRSEPRAGPLLKDLEPKKKSKKKAKQGKTAKLSKKEKMALLLSGQLTEAW